MSRPNIRQRLAAGDRLLLDGAMGSELQRRGVFLSHGVTDDGKLGPWSATALRDAPETVRQVHEDYLHAGADIHTTNSFWTNSVKLGMVGLADQAEAYTRLAAELAVEARDRLNPDAYVAGGMAPPGGGRDQTDAENLPREFAAQARIMADAGVDLLLPEYIGSVADCVAAVDAVAPTGLPVMLGVRHISADGHMQFGETFSDLVAALGDREVDAILLMCTEPAHITVAMPKLRAAYSGTVGAYANVGYEFEPGSSGSRDGHAHSIEVGDNTPANYAAACQAWLNEGARIVGGCCATTPEHIVALRAIV